MKRFVSLPLERKGKCISRPLTALLCITLTFSLCSCIDDIYSLYPFYTKSDIVFQRALLGEWIYGEGSAKTLTFEEGRVKSYRVIPGDEPANWTEAHLIKIGGHLFLDIACLSAADGETRYSFGLSCKDISGFFHVKRLGQNVQLRMLNPVWLSKFLADSPDAIAHSRRDEQSDSSPVAFLASTKEVQAFLIRHLDTDGAFIILLDLERAGNVEPGVVDEARTLEYFRSRLAENLSYITVETKFGKPDSEIESELYPPPSYSYTLDDGRNITIGFHADGAIRDAQVEDVNGSVTKLPLTNKESLATKKNTVKTGKM